MPFPSPTIIQNGDDFYFYSLLPNNGTGRDLTVGSGAETACEYEDLVPEGETRNIRITKVSLGVQGVFLPQLHQYIASLVVENEGKWKILSQAFDGDNYKESSFNPGVLLVPGDELCVQEEWNAAAYALYNTPWSWRFTGGSKSRILGVSVHYHLET